ncbi:hypothetical protein PAMA_002179 [Pampus argenteus]
MQEEAREGVDERVRDYDHTVTGFCNQLSNKDKVGFSIPRVWSDIKCLDTEMMILTTTLHMCLFYLFFIQPLGAQELQCTVTQDDRGTLYSMPEFQAEKCHYSWTDFNNSVLANHEGQMDGVVVTKSNRTLLIYKCSKVIRYLRDCISEGTRRTATCTSNCTENTGFQEDTGIASYVICVTVVTVMLLLLLVLFFLCKYSNLCKKFRGSICSCNQNRCIYTDMKNMNHSSNTTDVEATGV